MKLRGLFVLALFASVVSGCALAPGMHYSDSSAEDFDAFDKIELTPDLATSPPEVVQSDILLAEELLEHRHGEYQIGIYDVLQISIWDHPEFSLNAGSTDIVGKPVTVGKFVDTKGKIFVPYAGSVIVAGLSLSDAREKVAAKLSKYIESPQVDISIIEFGSQRFSVSGHVEEPGIKPLGVKPVNIIDAIGLAGGFSDSANRGDIKLVRDGKSYPINLIAFANSNDTRIYDIYIKSGDVIQVGDNRSNRVFVVGEVQRPQPVDISGDGLTLTDALGEVGGVNPLFAGAKSIYVVRLVENLEASSEEVAMVPTLYHLNGKSPVAFAIADNFQLKPKDVVFVGASAVTRWNRVISQMIPSFDFFARGRAQTVE